MIREPSAADLAIVTLAGAEAELRERVMILDACVRDLEGDNRILREALSETLSLLQQAVVKAQSTARLTIARRELERARREAA